MVKCCRKIPGRACSSKLRRPETLTNVREASRRWSSDKLCQRQLFSESAIGMLADTQMNINVLSSLSKSFFFISWPSVSKWQPLRVQSNDFLHFYFKMYDILFDLFYKSFHIHISLIILYTTIHNAVVVIMASRCWLVGLNAMLRSVKQVCMFQTAGKTSSKSGHISGKRPNGKYPKCLFHSF